MIRFALLAVFFMSAIILGAKIPSDSGYVLISIADSTLEMSFVTFVISFLIVFLLLRYVQLVCNYILSKIQHARAWWSKSNKDQSANLSIAEIPGDHKVNYLLPDQFALGEKNATKLANHYKDPLIAYLLSAHSAIESNDTKVFHHNLTLAEKLSDSDLPIKMMQARWFLKQKDYVQAVETLTALKVQYPHELGVLSALKQAYLGSDDWEAIQQLLPELERAQLITPQKHRELIDQIQLSGIRNIAENQSSEALYKYWRRISKTKPAPNIIQELIACLLEKDEHEKIFKVIKSQLRFDHVLALVQWIPRLTDLDMQKKIKLIQRLDARYPEDPRIIRSLAYLSIQRKQWQKAQSQFQFLLKMAPEKNDYSSLAFVLSQQKEYGSAHKLLVEAILLEN